MRYVRLLPAMLLVAMMGFAIGCETRPETPTETQFRLQTFGVNHFPAEATNVVERGNGWYTFDLVIDGQSRTFLYHLKNGTKFDNRECVTELLPR